MNEFKGIKVKWVFPKPLAHNETYETGINVWQKKEGIQSLVCNVRGSGLPKTETLCNALLISKSPEMLEMLQEFVLDFDNGLIDDFQIARDRFEKLIKEATEF